MVRRRMRPVCAGRHSRNAAPELRLGRKSRRRTAGSDGLRPRGLEERLERIGAPLVKLEMVADRRRWRTLKELEDWLEKPMLALSAVWLGLLVIEGRRRRSLASSTASRLPAPDFRLQRGRRRPAGGSPRRSAAHGDAPASPAGGSSVARSRVAETGVVRGRGW